MISTSEILLVLLGLGSFLFFRWFSRILTRKPNQGRQTRLARLGEASFLFQLAIVFSLLLAVYWVLAFLFGWTFFSQDMVRIVISQSHNYTAPAEMSPAIFALWLIKTGFGLGCAGVLFALFRLYGQGILFAAKNVNCLRFLVELTV